MHFALQGTHSDLQKVSETGEFCSSDKLLQLDDPKSSSGGFQISSVSLSYADQRLGILKLLTRESDGSWKIVSLPLPLQYFNHANHVKLQEQVNMDGIGSPPIKVDRWQNKKEPPPGFACSGSPFIARTFPANNEQRQFGRRTVSDKVTNMSELSSNSSHPSYVASQNPPSFMQKRAKTSNATDALADPSKEDKVAKRNSMAKARKKGKHNRKYWPDNDATGPEICSEHVHEGFTSEACLHSDRSSGAGLQSCAAASEVSSTDILDSEGRNGEIINTSGSPDLSTSDVDDDAIPGHRGTSLLSHFHREHTENNLKFWIQMNHSYRVFDGGSAGECTPTRDSHDDLSNGTFTEKHDSLVLDSVYRGSNSNETSRPTDDNGLCARASGSLVSQDGVAFSSNLQKKSADTNNAIRQMNYGVCAFQKNDVEVAVAGKRNKQLKTGPPCSSICKPGGTGSIQGRTGNENNHFVWQKVQKNGAGEHNEELKNMSPANSHFDTTLKQAPSFKNNNCVADVGTKSRFVYKKQMKDKTFQKSKQKSAPTSEQSKNCYSRKEPHISKGNLNAYAKTSMLRDGILDISTHPNCQKQVNSLSMPFMFVNGHNYDLRTMECKQLDYKPVQSSQAFPCDLESLENTSGTVSGTSDLDNGDMSSSHSKHPVFANQKNQPRQSVVYLPHLLVNYVSQMDKELSPAERSKQKQSSGSFQKWIPVGVKETGLVSMVPSGSSVGYSSQQGARYFCSGNDIDEKIALSSQNAVSSLNTGVMRMGGASENSSSYSQENKHFHKLININPDSVKGNHGKHRDSNVVAGSKHQSICVRGTDFSQLATVLNNVCKAQLASEAVQVETGHPIAEFERLLHFSCPVICQTDSSLNCQICLPNQVFSGLLCKHETPSACLGCLWEWYEKHGSYGLEIRSQDCENPKRLGLDRYLFRAYFVPYLSAVQLFKNCESSSLRNISGNHTLGHASGVGTSDESLIPPVSESHTSETIVSLEDAMPDSPSDMTLTSDLELLFEYFESEQPQKRRPLYEKIQELVTGDVPPSCDMYGDPSALNFTNLADLHPKSWYAVAWYPIYQIPDVSFRAAFLTYHSMGLLVCRATKVDHSTANSCIISPVVGLQSYNAQGEHWFRLRYSAVSPKAQSEGLNVSGILKERLRTLEEAAFVMSRAVVNKGNEKSVNRHPDFEYFLSRRG